MGVQNTATMRQERAESHGDDGNSNDDDSSNASKVSLKGIATRMKGAIGRSTDYFRKEEIAEACKAAILASGKSGGYSLKTIASKMQDEAQATNMKIMEKRAQEITRSTGSGKHTSTTMSEKTQRTYKQRVQSADEALNRLRAQLKTPVDTPLDLGNAGDGRDDVEETRSNQIMKRFQQESNSDNSSRGSASEEKQLDREQELRLAAEEKVANLYIKISDMDHKLSVAEENVRQERKEKVEFQQKVVRLENVERRLVIQLHQTRQAKSEAEEKLIKMMERMSQMDHNLSSTQEKLVTALKKQKQDNKAKHAHSNELKDLKRKLKTTENKLTKTQSGFQAVLDERDSNKNCIETLRGLLEDKERELSVRTMELKEREHQFRKELGERKKNDHLLAVLEKSLHEKDTQIEKLREEQRLQQRSLETNAQQNRYLLASLERARGRYQVEFTERMAIETELRSLKTSESASRTSRASVSRSRSHSQVPLSIVRPKLDKVRGTPSLTTSSLGSGSQESSNEPETKNPVKKPTDHQREDGAQGKKETVPGASREDDKGGSMEEDTDSIVFEYERLPSTSFLEENKIESTTGTASNTERKIETALDTIAYTPSRYTETAEDTTNNKRVLALKMSVEQANKALDARREAAAERLKRYRKEAIERRLECQTVTENHATKPSSIVAEMMAEVRKGINLDGIINNTDASDTKTFPIENMSEDKQNIKSPVESFTEPMKRLIEDEKQRRESRNCQVTEVGTSQTVNESKLKMQAIVSESAEQTGSSDTAKSTTSVIKAGFGQTEKESSEPPIAASFDGQDLQVWLSPRSNNTQYQTADEETTLKKQLQGGIGPEMLSTMDEQKLPQPMSPSTSARNEEKLQTADEAMPLENQPQGGKGPEMLSTVDEPKLPQPMSPSTRARTDEELQVADREMPLEKQQQGGKGPEMLFAVDEQKMPHPLSPSTRARKEEELLVNVPIHVKDMYQKVGFMKDRKTNLYFPILCLGPFSMPPGPAQVNVLNEPGDFLGVYFYGRSSYPSAYQCIKWFRMISYEAAVEKGYNKPHSRIERKIAAGRPLLDSECELLQGLKQIELEALKKPEERTHPYLQFQRSCDDKLREQQIVSDKQTGQKEGSTVARTNDNVATNSPVELSAKHKTSSIAIDTKDIVPYDNRATSANREQENVIGRAQQYLPECCTEGQEELLYDEPQADKAHQIIKATDSENSDEKLVGPFASFQNTFSKTHEKFCAVLQQFSKMPSTPVISNNKPSAKSQHKKNKQTRERENDIPKYVIAENSEGESQCVSEIDTTDVGLTIPSQLMKMSHESESDKLMSMLRQILGDDYGEDKLGLMDVKSTLTDKMVDLEKLQGLLSTTTSQDIRDTAGYPSDEHRL